MGNRKPIIRDNVALPQIRLFIDAKAHSKINNIAIGIITAVHFHSNFPVLLLIDWP